MSDLLRPDCVTDPYLVVSKLRSQEVKLCRSYRTVSGNISNRSVALENVDDDVDIIMAWDNIRENIKILAMLYSTE
jgi:hypothetical protein